MLQLGYSNEELLGLYSRWSEEYWAAGFMSPDPHTVRDFRIWLHNPKRDQWLRGVGRDLHDYEVQMLEEFKRQEEAADNADTNA